MVFFRELWQWRDVVSVKIYEYLVGAIMEWSEMDGAWLAPKRLSFEMVGAKIIELTLK